MVIRVSLSIPHNLLAQGIESYLERQSAILLVQPASPSPGLDNTEEAPPETVMLIGLDSLQPAPLEALRDRHARHPEQPLVVLADFRQPAELLSTLDAGALGCVSTTSQLDDVLQAICAASQGHRYLCQQLASLMLQGARRQHLESRERHGLGSREEAVLRLIADGYSSKEIARQLAIAPSTVDVHRRNIMRKIGLHKVADLTRFAIRHHMISL
jgi:two-component system NarL family response regulator